MPIERLRELARDPQSVTLRQLWNLLNRAERIQAIRAALDDKSPEWLRGFLGKTLVDRMGGFRLATVLGWDNERLASMASRQQIDGPAILRSAIIAFHMHHRPELQIAFLDRLGLPHDGGRMNADGYESPAASPQQVHDAADYLLEQFPPVVAVYYLLGAWCIAPKRWVGLDTWLCRFGDGAGGRAVVVTTLMEPTPQALSVAEELGAIETASLVALEEVPDSAAAPPVRITSESAKLSILDNQLILTVVDSGAGVTNSLSREQVDALLAEFITLNGRRHQSFYHLGYRDVLFGRPVAENLPVANLQRWRWYFAGYLAGLRRLEEFNQVVALYDASEIVTGLGDSGTGPSGAAAHHVFEALCHADDSLKLQASLPYPPCTNPKSWPTGPSRSLQICLGAKRPHSRALCSTCSTRPWLADSPTSYPFNRRHGAQSDAAELIACGSGITSRLRVRSSKSCGMILIPKAGPQCLATLVSRLQDTAASSSSSTRMLGGTLSTSAPHL